MLYTFLIILCLSLKGLDARAIDSTDMLLPMANITSSTRSEPINTTLSSDSCIDINSCRTLDDITQSCILTILACVWFAVHRNIPAPKANPPEGESFLHKLRRMIRTQWQAVIVLIVTLIAPEWILAWALRQMFRARELVGELEKASAQAKKMLQERGWETSESNYSSQEASGSLEGHMISEGSVVVQDESKKTLLVHRSVGSSIVCARCEKPGRVGSQCDRYASEILVGKTTECA